MCFVRGVRAAPFPPGTMASSAASSYRLPKCVYRHRRQEAGLTAQILPVEKLGTSVQGSGGARAVFLVPASLGAGGWWGAEGGRMDEPARFRGPRKLLPHVMSENFLQGTDLAVSGVLGAADLRL